MEKEKEYRIQCDVIRKVGENDNGKYDFLTYQAWDTHGKRCTLKFTKDCEGQPKKAGCYFITILKKDIKQDKSSRFRQYWVRAVQSFEEYDGFSSNADNEEDLPF